MSDDEISINSVSTASTADTEAARDNRARKESVQAARAQGYDISPNHTHAPDHVIWCQQAHNARVGHHGVERTIHKLQRMGLTWPTIRKDVRDFVQSCPSCQKMASLKRVISAPKFTIPDKTPWRTISVDLMGPYPKSVDGHEYLLVVVDTFSRYVELYPQPTKSAIDSAKSLLQTICRHGCPSYILTDSGTEFKNDLIQSLCRYLGISRRFTHPDSHQENAISERMNQEIDKHMRHIANDMRVKYQWSEYLPLVQRIMNVTEHSALKVAPHDLIFATNRLDSSFFKVQTQIPNSLPSYIKFIDEFLTRYEDTVHQAQLRELERQERHMLSKSSNNRVIFDIGTLVMLRPEVNAVTGKAANETRLDTKWRGPYVIQKRWEDDNTYTLRHLATNKEAEAQSYDLRIFKPQFADDDYILKTFQDAAKDSDNVALYKVHTHKFINLPVNDPPTDTPNHDLFFLVEYEDMLGQDRWVPWSVVKTQPLIHDYMRNDVQLTSRIPRYTRKDKRLVRLDHQRHQVIEDALAHTRDLTKSPSA
jgi:transposase InsO family protein